jgi:translocation and assembly module TamA
MFIFLLKNSTSQPFTGAFDATHTWNNKPRSRSIIRARRILPWLHLFCLLLAANGSIQPVYAQPTVVISISGDVNEIQQQNIRSHLSLARLKESDSPSETMFNRLYAKIEKEAASALEPFGYYTPNIIVSKQQLENGSRRIDLTVTTGPPVTIQQIQISLTGSGKEDAALQKAVQSFPLHLNDVLDHQLYEEAKEKLIAVALDSGYLKAGFRTNRVEIRRKAQSASINLQLDTGPRYIFGPLTFTADFIDHDLLRKISPVKEGEIFSPKALIRLRQSLFNADYFNTVELEYDIENPTAIIPVHVILTPNLAHKYSLGLGYGTDTGPRGTLGYTNRHINRFGHQLDLQLQPSERKSNFGGVYTIPIGDPKKDRLTILGKYEIETFAGTDSETLTSTISHDHFREIGEFSTYLRFLDEKYTTGLDTGHAALVIPGIKGSVFWADDRIATTRGIRITTSLIGSGAGVLADTSFLQAAVHTKGIYTFFEKWRVIGRTDLGTTLTDDIYALPPSLRYYTGGDQSVRGYGYKKISPTDAAGNVIGGKNLFDYSLELERILFDEWRAAVFYDSGTVMNTFSKFTLQSGAGIGVRWNAPFGQIRLDLAKPLDDENNSWRIHFTMGADL